uniref:leucine-rich repeat flightless-interacting protein 2 n=1 Tax=Centroberyx gerrardi TaxID=166262 RepID=UPI003AAB9F0C
MGTQGAGRKRNPNKERSTAEDDALNFIAREAEARLAAKRAARAEAREIRMKELERQQKEIFQVQKKYYGLDTKLDDRSDSKWGDIEQWMEDSERYSRPSRINTLSDDDERMSVGSRGSVRVEDKDYLEKGSRAASALTAATLTSLGGSSSRRGSGETAITVDTEASIREIKEIHELKDQIQDVESKYMQNLKEVKDALVEVEEKYRKAMVSNAQLDNEKNNLMYQVDTLKDSLMELEELLSESRREYEEKLKDFEREKHAHSVLQFQFSEMKETLKQSEELLNEIRQLRMKQDGFAREIADLQETVEWKDKKIGALERQKEYTDAIRIERDELRDEVVKLKDILKKHGIVLGPDLNINGDVVEAETEGSSSGEPATRLAQDSQTSPTEGNSMLEIRLRKLVDEREKMIEQVKKLKAQLEQKTQRNGTESASSPDGEILENGTDPNILELQRDANRHISDMKFKLVKAEQEVTALEQNVTRLEGQVTRYKSASENAEKVEDELKAEKRKLQRELRSALDKIDELESNNSHLSKRLEKMKTNRGTAQTP